MQGDNNLVLYNSLRENMWNTQTDNKGMKRAKLTFNCDTSMTLLDANNEVIWEPGYNTD